MGVQCALLLGLDGQVQELSTCYTFGGGGADCTPQLSPNGRAVLTCSKLLLPGQPPVNLGKPTAYLVAARFLTDSTLLTVYEYGEYQSVYDSLGRLSTSDFVVPARYRYAPNAFVLNLRSQSLISFHHKGYYDILGYGLPRRYVHQTSTYYLLDVEKGLQLLNRHEPR